MCLIFRKNGRVAGSQLVSRMARLVRRFGIVAILVLTTVLGRAQQSPQPAAIAPPKPDADAGPRIVIGSTPKADAATANALPVQPVAAPVADGGRVPNLNALITDMIRTMPSGGGYATNAQSFAALRQCARSDGQGRLTLNLDVAHPSFCSGATYLVFLSVIEELQRRGQLPLPPEVVTALEVRTQPDGTGIWGRWNANGPGTARLFYELGLGRNFTDFAEARPGDFIKMFWNEGIGSTERGHSAIFIGTSKDEYGLDTVTFWSSNVPGGYGLKTIPRTNIKRVLFSRLENPRGLAAAARLPARDDYLAAMLKRPSTPVEMMRMVGLGDRVPPPVLPEPIAPKTPAKPSATPGNTSGEKAAPAQTPGATPTPKKNFFQKVFGK